ncbi:TetR/AcrR family transcriptional regulator [Bogoriella caseilytica]|uniref:TetR family transcriptional regulator n=1 Tax=Bogoriella caseilytica TaxID=56055 RepID=A0A3N2BCH9_9MICO|nr:TetR/AcrR family transcriptional regulator [Bogoriella caseilytica]ROR72922.1 TetR family transcriptional regulator [Bogoriella caseilytica]
MSTTRRFEIAQAAAQEILVAGYEGASLASIAERIGLTKGALAYHFKTKADIAKHLSDVVRQATDQAVRYARQEYPDSGACRLLLSSLVMERWRAAEPQVAAGIALFGDPGSPVDSDDLVAYWKQLGREFFEFARTHRELSTQLDPDEAAELLLVTLLGGPVYLTHMRVDEPVTAMLRFVRLALKSAGYTRADSDAEQVLARYEHSLPELHVD